MTNNPCLRCSEPLLALLPVLLDPDQARVLPDDHDRRLRATFREVEQSIADLALPESAREAVMLALAALVDELVLCSAWPGREPWLHDTLQLSTFGDQLGGERFFSHLDEFRRHPRAHQTLLELYLACLQMGFRGIYRLRGEQPLHALTTDLCTRVEALREPVEPDLGVIATPQDMPAGTGRLTPTGIILMTLSLILAVTLFQGLQTQRLFQAGTDGLHQALERFETASRPAAEAPQ
ncbi:hypothetical protein ECTPHS_11582 [Ectothiorhodospira sp. PHS-1]|uniref:type IVB secretion system protein IcmH/DotU n=1 Tax=Ectothiorhodospira sp. PHS-1 TaxID=519989 RepID=UPI00024A8341|nr:type IVB secretion system protein IcmH/DotU [Ectothiorhodospira sp. PHS-1]EHQ53318.1 hypothetical protein ECTPHS_11582 [Ectothiorhodospira sp. PHS-1]